MTGSAHDRGEDGSWSIISSETGSDHIGSIVDHKSGYFVVAHFEFGRF